MRWKCSFVLAVLLFLCFSSLSFAQGRKLMTLKVGAVASGATTLPSLVISRQNLDEKYGLKIEWVKLGQASVQKAFALHQFDVNFAQTPLDLVRQRARGDKVVSFRSATLTNNYVVVKKNSPYQTMADLKGKKFGIFSWSSGSTAALNGIIKERYGLDLKRDYEVIVASPPALVGLLEKGEIAGSVLIDPIVIRLLSTGTCRQIVDFYGEWKRLTGSPLLVTSLASWEDFARKNGQIIGKLIKLYNEAVDYIVGHPEVYKTSGFIKQSLMAETTENVKVFNERFTRLYTNEAYWNQPLINSYSKVFQQAMAMKTLERIPEGWYTFKYLTR